MIYSIGRFRQYTLTEPQSKLFIMNAFLLITFSVDQRHTFIMSIAAFMIFTLFCMPYLYASYEISIIFTFLWLVLLYFLIVLWTALLTFVRGLIEYIHQ